jgi:transposase
MPPRHAKMQEWTPERVMAWAEKMGPSTRQVVTEIMARREHPQQGFRACLGILRLAKKHGDDRIEAACKRAVVYAAFSYKSIKSMLDRGLDKLTLSDDSAPLRAPVQHVNIRGPRYFTGPVDADQPQTQTALLA